MKELLKGSVTAAKNLLGWKLVNETPLGRVSGYIVETEAYDQTDPASHSFRGRTLRTEPMFQKAGTIYVYFTYGMHFCVNIVTGPADHGQAVLIRALEPIEGIESMKRNRGTTNEFQLTNGPAKLTQALGIDKSLNGTHIDTGPLFLEPGIKPSRTVQTTRIGINQAIDQPWRFYIRDNLFVSRSMKV